MTTSIIGIIGGSGLYEFDGLKNVKTEKITTPFGEPSGEYVTGEFADHRLVFLPRHGAGHRITPSEINYRANIWGMKHLGVGFILSVSAVGSMKEEIAPGHMVIPDQFIDLTRKRVNSFFGDGIVGHVSLADPICAPLAAQCAAAAKSVGATVYSGGTYVCIEGPHFSTRAESHVYRSWGVSVIGMTNATEAKLAREAEIHYSTIALATDYDCWHETHADVSVEAVLEVMKKNVATARDILKKTISSFVPPHTCGCANALQFAAITNPNHLPEPQRLQYQQSRARLDLILGKKS